MKMTSGSEIKQGLVKWINSMQGSNPWEYRYAEGCPPTLWASSFAGMALGFLGELDTLDEQVKQGWIKYLQGFQDEQTGLFIDPAFKSEDRESTAHSDELLHAHSSTFVMGAIARLGAKPLYPIAWTHQYHEKKAMETWIESLGWEANAWVVGNWSYDIGCAIGMDYLVTGSQGALDAANHYFDWYDRNQDSKTGWWDIAQNSPVDFQLYGGYHTLMIYWMFDRPIAMVEKIIDSSLSLQHEDGLFWREGGGGCCQDMDVIDPLVNLGLATGYRKDDITKCLERAMPGLLSKINPDGGMLDTPLRPRSEFGWKLCTAELKASEMCTAMFHPFSIALAAEFIGAKELLDVPYSYHDTYSHCVRRKVYLK